MVSNKKEEKRERMVLRRFWIFIFFVMFIGFTQATNLSITPSYQQVTAGNVFQVNVTLEDVTNLYSFQFDLNYDPSILQYVDVGNTYVGPFLSSGGASIFVLPPTVTPGFLDNFAATRIATTTGVSGSGVLAKLQFIGLSAGSSTITFSNDMLYNNESSPQQIVHDVSQGVVDVLASLTCDDDDTDGYGECPSCDQPACTNNGNDCDDTNDTIHPGATEICGNGVDDDCDGSTDEGCTNCNLINASWSITNVTNGTLVNLIVTGTNCNNQAVNFTIQEYDFLGGDDNVLLNPVNVNFNALGTIATGSWQAEWQGESFPETYPPEYYFITTLVSNASENLNSRNLGNSMLSVQNTNPVCEDGVINGAEQCDGVNLGGQTCVGLGYDSGTLECYLQGDAQECMFNITGCYNNPSTGPCQFTNANWSVSGGSYTVYNNSQVGLTVYGNTNCSGEGVRFEIWEASSTGDRLVSTNPQITSWSAGFSQMTVLWLAEYMNEFAPETDPPEYYFKAFLFSDETENITSSNPMLNVLPSPANLGYLNPELVNPTESIGVLKYTMFPFTSRVTCVGGNCGNVTAILDPFEDTGWVELYRENFSIPFVGVDDATFGRNNWLTFNLYNGGQITGDGNYAFINTPDFSNVALIRSTDSLPYEYKLRVRFGNVNYDWANYELPLDVTNGLNDHSGVYENGIYLIALSNNTCAGNDCNESWWHYNRKAVMDIDDHVGVSHPFYMVYMDPATNEPGYGNILRPWNGTGNFWNTVGSWNWDVAYTYNPTTWYYAEFEKKNNQLIYRLYDESENLLEESAPVDLTTTQVYAMNHALEYLYIGEPHSDDYEGNATIDDITLLVPSKSSFNCGDYCEGCSGNLNMIGPECNLIAEVDWEWGTKDYNCDGTNTIEDIQITSSNGQNPKSGETILVNVTYACWYDGISISTDAVSVWYHNGTDWRNIVKWDRADLSGCDDDYFNGPSGSKLVYVKLDKVEGVHTIRAMELDQDVDWDQETSACPTPLNNPLVNPIGDFGDFDDVLLYVTAGKFAETKGNVPFGSGTPFYTTSPNPYNCGILNSTNPICQPTWNLNATGDVGAYNFFVKYVSDIPGVFENDTEIVLINITSSCIDDDSDGYDNCTASDPWDDGLQVDCNDNNYYINPGEAEICTDGVDNNCDNECDYDNSVCGHGDSACSIDLYLAQAAGGGLTFNENEYFLAQCGIIPNAGINSVYADIAGQDCPFLIRIGSSYYFNCSVGSYTGFDKTVICHINTSRTYSTVSVMPFDITVIQNSICVDSDLDTYDNCTASDPGDDGFPVDCNDNDPLEKPNQVWYNDLDKDGYSNGTTLIQCLRPLNYNVSTELIETNTDCNNNNAAVHPGATEICNGIDDNCDTQTDEVSPNCVGATPYCSSGACVACTQNSHCDDSIVCTNDVCNAGICTNDFSGCGCPSGLDSECDDSNQCTDDTCVGFVCSNVDDDSNLCNDGQYCTVGDYCSSGLCLTSPRDCTSFNLPLIDTCFNPAPFDGIDFTRDFAPFIAGVCNEGLDTCQVGGTQTVTSTCAPVQCSAQCDENSDCSNTCIGDIYYTVGSCNSTCGCNYATSQNCSLSDGWVYNGTTIVVSIGPCGDQTLAGQEYRDYSCGVGGCSYSVTASQWSITGTSYDPPTTVCRSEAPGGCDIAEYCTGLLELCPGDSKSTAVCRPASGLCDVAEVCDGVSNDCPIVDLKQPAGTSCGVRDCLDNTCSGFFAQFYPLDGDDTCDGAGNCNIYSCAMTASYCTDNDVGDGRDGQVCGAACDQDSDCGGGMQCDLASCSCIASQCAGQLDGTPCDDGNYCNGVEQCVAQLCELILGNDVDCADSFPCTIDSCNEATDSCDYVANNTVCSNGLYCDGNEVCDLASGCIDGTDDPDCADASSCTADSCNEATDSCDNINIDPDNLQACCSEGGFNWAGNGGQLECCGDDLAEDNPFQFGFELNCADGRDNDCDGPTDCADNDCFGTPSCIVCVDSDKDGYNITGGLLCGPIDCDDRVNGTDGIFGNDDDGANIYPGATEVCGNSVDEDCSGADEVCPGTCLITNLYWNTTIADEGDTVELIIEGIDCDSASVDSFYIYDKDGLLGGVIDEVIGGSDDPALVSPPGGVSFASGVARVIWTAEWQDDGFFEFSTDPEYYFIATVDNVNYSSDDYSQLLNVRLGELKWELRTIPLYSGKNSFSLPLILDNYSIDYIFRNIIASAEKIYTYDGGYEIYHFNGLPSNLQNLEIGKGYIVVMNSDADLVINGTRRTATLERPSIPVVPGWNFMGTFSHSYEANDTFRGISYSELYTYNEGLGIYELVGVTTYLDDTKGYWILANDNATFIPITGQLIGNE